MQWTLTARENGLTSISLLGISPTTGTLTIRRAKKKLEKLDPDELATRIIYIYARGTSPLLKASLSHKLALAAKGSSLSTITTLPHDDLITAALELLPTSILTTTHLIKLDISIYIRMVSLPPGGRTLTYSVVNDHPIKLDYYLPASRGALPAIIYYHGGGMTAGSRRSAGLPYWMYDHCQEQGYIFISADYRLCHPSTALDQIDDAKRLFAFLAGEYFSNELPDGVSLDTSKIAVTGFSAGAYSARAACLYATPKPAVMMSVYGTGGDWLLDHWTRGRPATSIAKFVALESVPEFLADQTVISEDKIPVIVEDGKSRSRFALTVRWELDGTFLDGCLGRPGLGRMLDEVKYEERANVIPEDLRPAFLQLFVDETYPPSVFVHGTADEVVSPEESVHHHETLERLGVNSELFLVQDGGHGLMELGKGRPRPAAGATEAYIMALEFIDEVFGR